jgi:hypothetical protein
LNPARQDACAALLRSLLQAYKWVSAKQFSGLQVGEVQDYLDRGPGFIFLYHPALGPLWDVIGQKVCCTACASVEARVQQPATGFIAVRLHDCAYTTGAQF